MEKEKTVTPTEEKLFFEHRDNGDLIVNTKKSTFFLVVATDEAIEYHCCVGLSESRAHAFVMNVVSKAYRFSNKILDLNLED